MDWWIWLIILLGIIVVIFVIWWFLRPKKAAEAAKPVDMPAPPVAATADDELEIIEGIGPKIGAVLKSAGIHTFAKLATMQPEEISSILTNSGIRLADPTSWPEQARLAAAGKMEELKTLQDSLKGGRKV